MGFLHIIYSFNLHSILIHLIYIAYYTSMNEYIINHVLITLQVLIYESTYDVTCILIHLNSTLSTQ